MSFITDLFSSSVGEVIGKVGEAVDSLVTSDEERLKLRNELIKLQAEVKLKEVELENKYQEQITKRWEADSTSESWLPRNIRPLSLAYMLGVITIMAFSDGNIGEFTIDNAYVELFQTLMVVSFTAYFGGRTIQKLKNVK